MDIHTTTYTTWPIQVQLPACESCKFNLTASRKSQTYRPAVHSFLYSALPQGWCPRLQQEPARLSNKGCPERSTTGVRGQKGTLVPTDRHSSTYNLNIKLKKELLKKRVCDQITDSSSPLGFLSLILEIDTCLAAGSDKNAYFHTTHIFSHLNTKLKLIVNSECTYSTETTFCTKKKEDNTGK